MLACVVSVEFVRELPRFILGGHRPEYLPSKGGWLDFQGIGCGIRTTPFRCPPSSLARSTLILSARGPYTGCAHQMRLLSGVCWISPDVLTSTLSQHRRGAHKPDCLPKENRTRSRIVIPRNLPCSLQGETHLLRAKVESECIGSLPVCCAYNHRLRRIMHGHVWPPCRNQIGGRWGDRWNSNPLTESQSVASSTSASTTRTDMVGVEATIFSLWETCPRRRGVGFALELVPLSFQRVIAGN